MCFGQCPSFGGYRPVYSRTYGIEPCMRTRSIETTTNASLPGRWCCFQFLRWRAISSRVGLSGPGFSDAKIDPERGRKSWGLPPLFFSYFSPITNKMLRSTKLSINNATKYLAATGALHKLAESVPCLFESPDFGNEWRKLREARISRARREQIVIWSPPWLPASLLERSIRHS